MSNYYEILELQNSATFEDICKSYRRLALKFHPARNTEDIATHTFKFSQIAEAFQVLSDSKFKAIYDKYGEEVLKNGIPHNPKGKKHCYCYYGNALDIFEQFFGTSNPFVDIATGQQLKDQNLLMSSSLQDISINEPSKAPDVEVGCECTLEELYNGCIKAVTFERDKLMNDGKTTKKVNETINVTIKRGYGSQTVFRHPGKGNEAYAYPTSDLIINIVELPHERFTRKNDDLYYTQQITLASALCPSSIILKTLDGRNLMIPIDEVITPTTQKIVQNEGMPISSNSPLYNLKNEFENGCLVVKFNIIFPRSISEENKLKLIQILK